jgi:hypothetical protein
LLFFVHGSSSLNSQQFLKIKQHPIMSLYIDLVKAAAFIIAPIILAFVIQQPALFLAAIGAIVLTTTAMSTV